MSDLAKLTAFQISQEAREALRALRKLTGVPMVHTINRLATQELARVERLHRKKADAARIKNEVSQHMGTFADAGQAGGNG